MNDSSPASEARTSSGRTMAYVAPFCCFMAFLAIPDLLLALSFSTADGAGNDSISHLNSWLYPLQTTVTVMVLAALWKHVHVGPHTGWLLAGGTGVLSILMWILPGHLFDTWQMSDGWWKFVGFAARTEGFNPTELKTASTAFYGFIVTMRFIRLVVVAPIIEELFWRGFMMRYLVAPDGDYWKVPFGTYHRRSLIIVTAMVVIVHAPVDYFGALLFGLLMYGIAVRTKSLSACILMHATANLLLGLYVMSSHKWGYW